MDESLARVQDPIRRPTARLTINHRLHRKADALYADRNVRLQSAGSRSINRRFRERRHFLVFVDASPLVLAVPIDLRDRFRAVVTQRRAQAIPLRRGRMPGRTPALWGATARVVHLPARVSRGPTVCLERWTSLLFEILCSLAERAGVAVAARDAAAKTRALRRRPASRWQRHLRRRCRRRPSQTRLAVPGLERPPGARAPLSRWRQRLWSASSPGSVTCLDGCRRWRVLARLRSRRRRPGTRLWRRAPPAAASASTAAAVAATAAAGGHVGRPPAACRSAGAIGCGGDPARGWSRAVETGLRPVDTRVWGILEAVARGGSVACEGHRRDRVPASWVA